MKFIKYSPKADEIIRENVKEIDEDILNEMLYEVLNIKDIESPKDLYNKFYKSNYPVNDLTSKANYLENYFKKIAKKNKSFTTFDQERYYKHVYTNYFATPVIRYRYYFNINPNNMHELIKILTKEFINEQIPVYYKYQLEDKYNYLDRLVVYTGIENDARVLKVISKIYKNNAYLFEPLKRALPWFNESIVPNVYNMPETPGTSFGMAFARMMKEAKDVISYLDNSNLDEDKNFENYKIIISSLLLKNNLLLTKDKQLLFFDNKIKTKYDYVNKTLERVSLIDDKLKKVVFSNNEDGIIAFLENFYNISKVIEQEEQNKIKVLNK